MAKTKRTVPSSSAAGSSSGAGASRAKKTKYESLPVPPKMVKNFRHDPGQYIDVLTDDGEEERIYVGPYNKPVLSKLHRAEEKRWLTKDAHSLYLSWSDPHNKLSYRAVLGGRFIHTEFFINAGFGQLITNLTDMGWLDFAQIDHRYDESLVRQFYANLYADNGHYHTVVGNQIISFTPAVVNELVGANNEGSEFCLQGSFSDIVDFDRLRELFPGQLLSSAYKLKMTHFLPIHRIAYALVTEIFCPRGGHKTDITHMGLHWLMGIWFRVPINLGFFVCRYMMDSQFEKKHMLPYGRLIMRIIQSQQGQVTLEPDVGSKDLMGQDFFKDNHLALVNGQWLYRKSKLRRMGPGSASGAIYDDVEGGDADIGEIPAGQPTEQHPQQQQQPPQAPAQPEESNVRTHEFKALHHRMTNLEKTVKKMQETSREVQKVTRMMEFHFRRTWTQQDWQAFQSSELATLPDPASSDSVSAAGSEEEADEEEDVAGPSGGGNQDDGGDE